MPVLRFLSGLLLLIAVIALVADMTPWLVAGKPCAGTSLAKHWADLAPATLQAARSGVQRSVGTWAWDLGPGALIALPTYTVFGLLALLLGWAGRHRRRVSIFVN